MNRMIVVFFLLAVPIRAEAEKVLIASDPQYGWSRTPGCEEERKNFRKLVGIVNTERFDALIILGDYAQAFPNQRRLRARQVSLFLKDLRKVRNVRIYLVAGNHDLGKRGTRWAERKYVRTFGFPTRYAFRRSGHKFLVLNATLLQNRRRYPRSYRRQLRFVRKNADAKFILVHYPPFHQDPEEGDDYFRLNRKPRKDLLRLLSPGTYIFSGHLHRPLRSEARGLLNISVGTCCAAWNGGLKTYGVLEITPGTIRYTEKRLR